MKFKTIFGFQCPIENRKPRPLSSLQIFNVILFIVVGLNRFDIKCTWNGSDRRDENPLPFGIYKENILIISIPTIFQKGPWQLSAKKARHSIMVEQRFLVFLMIFYKFHQFSNFQVRRGSLDTAAVHRRLLIYQLNKFSQSATNWSAVTNNLNWLPSCKMTTNRAIKSKNSHKFQFSQRFFYWLT